MEVCPAFVIGQQFGLDAIEFWTTISSFSLPSAPGPPCLDDYEVLRTLVREKHTYHLYTLKAIDKYTVTGRKVSCSMLIMSNPLTELNGSDFVPLHACFHDTEYFYLVTQYLPGGDLQHLQPLKEFDEEMIGSTRQNSSLPSIMSTHTTSYIETLNPRIYISIQTTMLFGGFGIVCDLRATPFPIQYVLRARPCWHTSILFHRGGIRGQ